eukprot:720312_1
MASDMHIPLESGEESPDTHFDIQQRKFGTKDDSQITQNITVSSDQSILDQVEKHAPPVVDARTNSGKSTRPRRRSKRPITADEPKRRRTPNAADPAGAGRKKRSEAASRRNEEPVKPVRPLQIRQMKKQQAKNDKAVKSEMRTQRLKTQREWQTFRKHQQSMKEQFHRMLDEKTRQITELIRANNAARKEIERLHQDIKEEQAVRRKAEQKVAQYSGDDFQGCNLQELQSLEETSRHLLYQINLERKNRMACFSCNTSMVGSLGERDRNAERFIIFYPCRHARICENCALGMERCPICARTIKRKVAFLQNVE